MRSIGEGSQVCQLGCSSNRRDNNNIKFKVSNSSFATMALRIIAFVREFGGAAIAYSIPRPGITNPDTVKTGVSITEPY